MGRGDVLRKEDELKVEERIEEGVGDGAGDEVRRWSVRYARMGFS